MSKINLGVQGQQASLDTGKFLTNSIPSSAIKASTANVSNGLVLLDSQTRLPAVDGSLLINVTPGGSSLWTPISIVRVSVDTDEVAFSSLDLDTDKVYKVYVVTQAPSGGTYYIFYNGDENNSNYQRFGIDTFISNSSSIQLSASIGGGKFESFEGYQGSFAQVSFPAGYSSLIEIDATVSRAQDTGEVTAMARSSGFRDSQYFSSRWVITGANVTDLKVKCDNSVGFPIGSCVALYKLGPSI